MGTGLGVVRGRISRLPRGSVHEYQQERSDISEQDPDSGMAP
jgi:hypothetical protein